MLFNVAGYTSSVRCIARSSTEEQPLAKEFVTVLRSEAISARPVSGEAFIDLSGKKTGDRESALPVFYGGKGRRDNRAMSEDASH